MTELLIGCGHKRDRRIETKSSRDSGKEWNELITLDQNPDVKPDILHDLTKLPYPLYDNSVDEIHAYEVLEHIGQQGDYLTFFAQFTEFHRILKPNGLFCATVPMWNSLWAWSDPSHTRVISNGTLVFLSQKQYEAQAGKTPMTDFRYIYKADFDIVFSQEMQESFVFVLKAIKDEPT